MSCGLCNQSWYVTFYTDGKEHDIVGESELKNGEAYLNITHNQNVYINNPKDLLSASEKKVKSCSYSVHSLFISSPLVAKSLQEL